MPDVSVNGTRLHYRFDGAKDAPVVMLSNSLASNLAMWDRQVPALVEAGFRVLRYDSRGHGASEAPAGPYTIEQLGDDAIGLMDALGLERVHFCGLSKGGMVGQSIGARQPARVASLALCATASHPPGAASVWDERVAAVRAGGMQAVVDGTIDRWFTAPGQQRLPGEVAAVREMILTTPVEGFCACCAAIRDMDLRDGDRGIRTPTTIIVGEQDPGTPVAAAEAIHELIEGSSLHVIPDAAHFVNVEQTEAFNEVLLGFLRAQA